MRCLHGLGEARGGGGLLGHAARIMCGELEFELAQDSESDQTSDQEVTELTEDLEAYDTFLRSVELYTLKHPGKCIARDE